MKGHPMARTLRGPGRAGGPARPRRRRRWRAVRTRPKQMPEGCSWSKGGARSGAGVRSYIPPDLVSDRSGAVVNRADRMSLIDSNADEGTN